MDVDEALEIAMDALSRIAMLSRDVPGRIAQEALDAIRSSAVSESRDAAEGS